MCRIDAAYPAVRLRRQRRLLDARAPRGDHRARPVGAAPPLLPVDRLLASSSSPESGGPSAVSPAPRRDRPRPAGRSCGPPPSSCIGRPRRQASGRRGPGDLRRPGAGAARPVASAFRARSRAPARRRRGPRPHRGALAPSHLGDAEHHAPDRDRRRVLAGALVRAGLCRQLEAGGSPSSASTPPRRSGGSATIERALESDGPLSRARAGGAASAARGSSSTPPRRLHLFRLAIARGIACLGPDAGVADLLALARDWLGERPPHDREAALDELARRYLRRLRPGDRGRLRGLGRPRPAGDPRRRSRGIGGELVEARVGDRSGVDAEGRRQAPAAPDRPPAAGLGHLPDGPPRSGVHRRARRWRRIMPGGGMLRPSIVVDGVAVGHLAAAARRAAPKVEVGAVRRARRGGRRGDRGRGR